MMIYYVLNDEQQYQNDVLYIASGVMNNQF